MNSKMIAHLILAAFSLSTVAFAQEETPAPQATPPKTEEAPAQAPGKQPKIQAENDTHDFGIGWAGPALQHAFVLKNVGEATLEISRVAPSCGCTVAGNHPKKLEPGESGEFSFSLHTDKINGPFEKLITVHSNDTSNPQLKLKLKGQIKQRVSVTPPVANFGKLTDSKQAQERVVQITNNTDTPLELTLEKAADATKFQAELIEKEKGKSYELKVKFDPAGVTGNQMSSFVLSTNIEEQKKITVQASAMIPPRLDVQPPSIMVRENPAPANGAEVKTMPRMLRFINSGETLVKVLEVSIDDPALKASIQEKQPGKEYHISVELPADYMPPETGRTLTIKTDDAQTPTIAVPIKRLAIPAPAKPQPRPADQLTGQKAPEISLKTSADKVVSNEEFTKSPATVLNFVAPNCGFCKKQMPMVESVRKEYEAKGVRFINVNQKMGTKVFTPADAEQVFKGVGSGLEFAFDTDNQFGRNFKVSGFPTLFVINKEGKITQVHGGAKPDIANLLKQNLDALLK